MTKSSKKLSISIIIITAILTGLSFIGLLSLPDKIQSGPDIPHLSTYWLVFGIIHCGLVVFLAVFCLVKISNLTFIEIAVVICIVILWLYTVIPGVYGNYWRNRITRLPINMIGCVIEPNDINQSE